MNREMIVQEWRRAVEALGAAETLLGENYATSAVSRAYYAIMHAVRAALFVHDVSTTSHAGMQRMFGLHLIRSGEIESEWAAALAESMDGRLEADYDVYIHFSMEKAAHECKRAREFLDRIRRYLLENGITENELLPENDDRNLINFG